MKTPKNLFLKGQLYNASQNISRLSLSNGHCPLFYQDLEYSHWILNENGNIEHVFYYENDKKWFDDDFINNGKSEDNSMVFGIKRVNS